MERIHESSKSSRLPSFALYRFNCSRSAAGDVQGAAPELEERSDEEWINSKPLKLSELRGQVVVLHFWTFGCVNCQHNFPTLKAWQTAFADKGVTIIGVHTPETERERQIENVRKSARRTA